MKIRYWWWKEILQQTLFRYTVKLTYSGPLTLATEIPENYIEKNAVVAITDDLGNATELSYTGSQGVYQTTDPLYVGQAGRSYHVTIKLPDGKTFVSTPEKIAPPVSFSNISVEFENDFDLTHPMHLNVYADIDDPADQENYYKWNFYSYVMRQTRGISCGFNCIMYEYCFQKITDNQTRIFSDRAINGNKITRQLMGYSYIYAIWKTLRGCKPVVFIKRSLPILAAIQRTAITDRQYIGPIACIYKRQCIQPG